MPVYRLCELYNALRDTTEYEVEFYVRTLLLERNKDEYAVIWFLRLVRGRCRRGKVGIVSLRYTQNGILHMLDRNRRIKPRPERFQSCKDVFDVIVTCEERVYDQLVEDLESRPTEHSHPMHVINLDIQDNHEEATIGAFLIRDLVSMLTETEDLDNEIDEIIQEFEHASNRSILHSVMFI